MDGKIAGITLSRDLLKGKMQTGVGYRYVRYRLPENLMDISQHIGEINFSWQLLKGIYLSLNYEGTFEQKDKYNRLYAQIRKRF
jgi:hypothetical protein